MEYGYCENINKNRRIKIAYVSLPQFDNEPQEFIKIENLCIDLIEGRCNKGNNCAIFQMANEVKGMSEI